MRKIAKKLVELFSGGTMGVQMVRRTGAHGPRGPSPYLSFPILFIVILVP